MRIVRACAAALTAGSPHPQPPMPVRGSEESDVRRDSASTMLEDEDEDDAATTVVGEESIQGHAAQQDAGPDGIRIQGLVPGTSLLDAIEAGRGTPQSPPPPYTLSAI